jgi:hypothetical protein
MQTAVATYKKINPFLYLMGFALLNIGAIAALTFFTQKPAEAASAAGFNSGNIIDDLVFTNKNTMSPDQIQVFLNSKVPTCDTWGTQPSEFGGGTRAQWGSAHGAPPPYTCIKDYYEGGYSAAQIIYNTAQEFSINPQVLIVLLQKEQALITDTWPTPGQYRSATGYGCPDSTPGVCDSSYYGFTNQVRWAARMFRAIFNNSPNWYTPYVLGNNYIQYNPNSSCGGSVVNIENRATQSLYNYTPYQPNQGALNAGYGTAPCGAYGNRNFYLYFIDWFGTVRASDSMSPHPDGTVIALDDSAYQIQGGARHLITNGPAFESNGFRWQDVKPGTTGDRNLPVSWQLNFIQPGMLYTGDPSGVYVTVYENNTWTKKLVTYDAFMNMGYRWSQVTAINSDFMPQATSANALTSTDRHPDGTLINDDGSVYYLDHGTRRYVDRFVFESQRWDWNDIVPASTLDKQLPLGATMLLKEGAIISDSTNLYVVKLPSSGPEIKRPIGPWTCYNSVFRYTHEDIVYMTLDKIPATTGPNVTCE